MLACGLANPKFFLMQKSSGLMNYFILNLTIKSMENPLENSKFLLKSFLNLMLNCIYFMKFYVFSLQNKNQILFDLYYFNDERFF